MSDPVSWLLVERGWKVVDAAGEEIGQVEEALGERDIFSGLVISTGLLGSPRWVRADGVDELVDGCVRLRLSGDEVEQLPKYDPPEPA